MSDPSPTPRIRWWPAIVVLVVGVGSFLIVFFKPTDTIQVRNVALEGILGLIWFFLTVWWFAASRASWKSKLRVYGAFVGLCLAFFAVFRVRGVTGDFVPIFESRFASRNLATLERGTQHDALDKSGRPDFPQYLGPNRNAVITDSPVLARDWDKTPPQILWRKSIGDAWSGFAIVGNRAVTFAQKGEYETVICLDVLNGTLLWEHTDLARYDNKYGGIGGRSTPAIHDGRVYTFGATGIVNCIDLVTGKLIWQRTMEKDAPKGRPEWGYAGSPLVHDGKVLISAGQSHEKSLYAYSVKDGEVVWREGDQPAEYSSPMFCTLAGVPQIISFNMLFITSHDPEKGTVLWEYPWGINRQPVMAQPLPVGPDRIVFSSGYGVGAELLEIKKDAAGKLTAEQVWKSMNMKSKMASMVHRDGYIYGLDDGILACIQVDDAKRKWKGGRYGHGQFLFVGDLMLLTAENGELVLLAPTPEGPNELCKFRIFDGKTWNPPALSGDILLMRTDVEVACVKLPLAKSETPAKTAEAAK